MKFVETKKLNLKENLQIFETHIQNLIIDSPSIIGLGEYYAHDRERIQFRGGKLDILLKSEEDPKKRIAVEVQLGKLDYSHFMRAYEYYLNEKEKFPHYDISALLICEEGNDRILPVIRDLCVNKPFKVILLKAFTIDEGKYSCQFHDYFSGTPLALEEEDEEVYEKADRKYWMDRRPEGLKIVDEFMGLINTIAPNYKLNYLKGYIGLSNGHGSNNFVVFWPNKDHMVFGPKLDKCESTQNLIDETNFSYLPHSGKRYRIRIKKEKIQDKTQNQEILLKLIQMAYENSK